MALVAGCVASRNEREGEGSTLETDRERLGVVLEEPKARCHAARARKEDHLPILFTDLSLFMPP